MAYLQDSTSLLPVVLGPVRNVDSCFNPDSASQLTHFDMFWFIVLTTLMSLIISALRVYSKFVPDEFKITLILSNKHISKYNNTKNSKHLRKTYNTFDDAKLALPPLQGHFCAFLIYFAVLRIHKIIFDVLELILVLRHHYLQCDISILKDNSLTQITIMLVNKYVIKCLVQIMTFSCPSVYDL